MRRNRNIITALLLIGFVFFIKPLKAQQVEDVLYLKNGGVIRGTILEINSERKIKVEIVGRNIFIFDMNEVDKIVREQAPVPPAPLVTETLTEYPYDMWKKDGVQESGYIAYLGPSFYIGNGFSSANIVTGGFHWVNSYQFKQHYIAGVGVGIEGFGTTLMPVFGDFRYNLFAKELHTPYAYTRGGYTLPLQGSRLTNATYKGGGLFEAGIGITKYLGYSTGFTFSLGYRYQQVNYIRNDWWGGNIGITEVKEIFHRLAIRLNLML